MTQLPRHRPLARTTRRAGFGPIRSLLLILTVGSLAVLGACGGDDDESGTENGTDTDQTTDAGADDGDAGDGGGDTGGGGSDETFDPAEVATCLSDAGYETETSTETLNEQQVADQLTAFGQTEALTFDAAANGFAGGVSFYETPEQAQDRAQSLGEVAKEQRVIGNALVNIEAGSDYGDAVATAESCLGE